ncbi:CoxG family protein [Haloplanus aerogenes]|uniref:Carbon monoxide dehydrogenase subunit G n=1 Tax=Haloplanus aerogenes TaxID=660522 RepID=A0A3M0DSZ8_9EURY|nr:SRPBCC family protein [Haloplanus aerogenes]AZH25530.1 polyketide cyclase [Haloplanus aerogenes]RMB25244.1 carbon monoxide dehydrogenase subunit G [Haloplanus aerogenes]
MTVTVERVFDLSLPIEEVWSFISDPENRARSIQFVDEYQINGDEATWYVKIPVRFLNRRITVETRDVDRDPPHYVRFVGKSKVMRVVGEHELQETDDGCKVTIRFRVQEKLPGVERFFKANIDDEIQNLIDALKRSVGD